MKRVRHLIAYDIRDPKRLRAVHKIMRGHGFPFQYSVFVCDLTPVQRFRLLSELENAIDRAEDSVAAVEVGDPSDDARFTYLGPHANIRPAGPRVL